MTYFCASNRQFQIRYGRESGHIAVEYSLVTLTLVVVLFVPMPLLGMSLVEWVLEALRGFQSNTSFLLSLP